MKWYAHANRHVRDDQRAWMGALPRRIDVAIGGRRLAVIHGGVEKIADYIFASTPDAEKTRQIALAGVDGVIGGHCGLPFTQMIGAKLWHNSGALGMPANDGTARVWFSILTPEAGGLRISHHALEYDHASAAAKMRAAGLPEGYAAALSSGLWPSLDVLPETERRASGAPLQELEIIWPA
jgi:predicted phosphodiesterase